MPLRPHTRKLSLAAAAGSLALAAVTLTTSPGLADGPAPGTVLTAGLNNPRLLSFGPDGSLYVAEAGTGANDPNVKCVTGGDGPSCFSLTGSVTRVRDGVASRVLTGLPSMAGTDGSNPVGPVQLLPENGGHYVLSMGAGVALDQRQLLPASAQTLGTVVRGKFGHRAAATGDLVAWEYQHNPDNSAALDSDPAGITRNHGHYVVADAGGNTLMQVDGHHVRELAVFPTNPAFQGPEGPIQAVPTAVAVGPVGAYYVSQLTGAPFPAGSANIWRVVPGEAPTVYASGLTNVTDLAWSGDQLYAVELSNGGLATTGPTGSLIQVHPGANDPSMQAVTRAGSLPAPYGVAIRDGVAYVSIGTLFGPGQGAVMEFPLD